MPLRPCLGCGRITQGSRCPACRLPSIKPHHSMRRPDYTKAERERRAEAVRVWVEEYGHLCPGWGVPPHASADLTADHVHAVHAGGDEGGPLAVLCPPPPILDGVAFVRGLAASPS